MLARVLDVQAHRARCPVRNEADLRASQSWVSYPPSARPAGHGSRALSASSGGQLLGSRLPGATGETIGTAITYVLFV
jgi:hypothetical protein